MAGEAGDIPNCMLAGCKLRVCWGMLPWFWHPGMLDWCLTCWFWCSFRVACVQVTNLPLLPCIEGVPALQALQAMRKHHLDRVATHLHTIGRALAEHWLGIRDHFTATSRGDGHCSDSCCWRGGQQCKYSHRDLGFCGPIKDQIWCQG